MFRLDFIEVENWCQHRSKRIEFVPGTNGIIGRNGVGKSNMLLAGFTALTGVTIVGNLADNIHWECDKAKVTLGFSLDGLSGTVTRTVTAGYTEVTPDDGSPKKRIRENAATTARLVFGEGESKVDVKGVRQVGQKVEELTGLSAGVLTDHSFITQGHLFDLLFKTSAVRLGLFLSLIPEVSVAEMRREDLKHEIERFPLMDSSALHDEVKKQLEDCKTRYAIEAAELSRLQLARGTEQVSDLWAISTRGAEAEQNRETQRRVESQLAAAITATEAERLAARTAAQQMQEYQQVLEELGPEAAKAEVALAAVENSKAIMASRKRAEASLATAEAEFVGLGTPAVFTQESELVALGAQRDALLAKYGPAVAFSRFLETGKNECPVCLAKHENPAEKLAWQREIIAQLTPQIAEVNAKVAKLSDMKRAAEGAAVTHAGDVRRLQGVISECKRTLATLPVVSESSEATEGLRELVSSYKSGLKELETLKTKHAVATSKAETSAKSVERLTNESLALMAKLVGAPTVAEAAAAMVKAQQLAGQDSQIANRDGALKALLEERERLTFQADALQKVEDQAVHVRKYRELLTHARDNILHRDYLPQEVLLSRIGELEDSCNKYLDMFGKPFVVHIERDMTIVVTDPDGYAQQSERLSGGEKCVLSIAFRVAINDLFAPKLGFVVLDEPTEFTDSDNVKYIADMVEKIGSRGGEGGLQVIVITHAKELIPAFENVIQITGG